MNKESNIFKNIISVLLALLVLALAAGTASAANPSAAGTVAADGINVTINSTSATGIPAPTNLTDGARITVYFNKTNASATNWIINATNQSVSINGSTPGINGTIANNGTFTLNSSVSTDLFNVTVSNADNTSENATLTGFRFVAPVELGTAGNFAILAGSAITGSAGTDAIIGDVGLSPASGSFITNLAIGEVTGTIYAVDDAGPVGSVNNSALLTTAKGNLTTAYNDAAGRTPATTVTASTTDSFAATGYTLAPGTYNSGSTMGITGTLTLSGSATDVWIFQAGTSLTTATSSNVVLTGGAQARNVFWQVGSSATLGDTSNFNGTILALTAVTVGTGVNVEGRVLAQNSFVTLSGASNITSPSYSPSVNGTPNITSWGNNKTNDQSLSLTVNASESVNFNATPNQTIVTWNWFKDDVNQNNNYDNLTANFTAGAHTVKVNATNANGTSGTITWSVTVPGAPGITSFAPLSPVNDTVGATRVFNITVNQTVNVTWYINGTNVGSNVSVTDANYTNTSAVLGIWNVTAIANNSNGTVSREWTWNVTALPPNSTQAPVALGTAGNFAYLAGTAWTCTGSTINGDVGVSPGTAVTKTGCTINGANYTNNSVAIAANSSFLSAYDAVDGMTVDGALTGTLAGITLSPGIYSFDIAAKTGTLTLNAAGNASAVWIFKSAATDTGYLEANSFSVVMAGGGVASNVFWWVPAYAALTDSNFQGTILAGSYITVTRGTFNGTALAKAGVTMTDTVVNGPSSSSVPPVFVTSLPIRMLNGTGPATRYPTSVYYYYNGSTIRINVSLNQTNLNVSGDFSPMNTSLINTNTSFLNATGEYIYTLTAIAGSVGMGAYPINITAINTTTGATNVSAIPPMALMNINPQAIDLTLGGTNWTTGIADFTDATLTFEKFNDTAHTSKIGTLEFLGAMNLADNTTATALQNLGNNLNMAATSMNLNSTANALAAMNVFSRLSMYNLTDFTNSPGILVDGTPIVAPGQTSGGAVSSLTWNSTNYSLVFQVSHWTNYSVDGQPPVITFESPTPANVSETSASYVNVSVTLSENGTARLSWNGVNESMVGVGTSFYNNKTSLLSGNYTFKVYANDTVGNTNVSETRIVTVNRTTVNTTIGTIINTSTFITNETLDITAPSGNVTVTIPNGTNASVGGVALTSISIDSLARVNSTFAAIGSNDRFVGENLSMGPDGAIFSPDIQIRFNYTDAQLNAAGIDASTLRVKFYNTTTNTWVEQTPYTLNTTGKYITANVSHFSTFALLGTVTTTTTTTTTDGGGAGTGGGGIVTSEPYTNIEKAERYDKSLIANTPVTYAFKAPELGIYEIAITGKESENDIALRVEVLKGTSKLVTVQAPGTVYKNVNVWAGTKRMKEALIRFKVENTWLGSNSLAGSDVKMVKWDGSQWVQIETAEKTKDDTYTYYEAKTDTFSVFAITGLKGGVIVPTATPAGAVTETPVKPTGTATPAGTAPAPAPTKKVPGFELVLVAAALCSMYLFGRKRR